MDAASFLQLYRYHKGETLDVDMMASCVELRLRILSLMDLAGGLYVHFATSVIHEITSALGIYCFRYKFLPSHNVSSLGCGETPLFELFLVTCWWPMMH